MKYKHLHFDYETFSLVDLQEVGIDNYAKHPSTGISMMGWALDDEEVEIWLPHLGPMPEKLLNALLDPIIIKIAWNASFEYNITNEVAFRGLIGRYVPIQEFRDPTILGAQSFPAWQTLEGRGNLKDGPTERPPRRRTRQNVLPTRQPWR